MQLLKRSTAVPDDPDHPARRWFRRWSLWPPVLELPPCIRWVRASPAYPDHPIAGALIAAAAPLKPWIDLTPSFPTHSIAGVHLVPIGPEGQSALDGDPDDPQCRRFGARSYGDLSDAVVVTGELATAGADVVFIEAPRSMEDLETIVGAFPDAPLFANMIEGGVTLFLSYQELQEIGFKTVVYPLSSLFTTANAVARMLGVLRKTGTTAGFDHKVSFEEFEAIVDTPKYRAMESAYAVR